MSTFPKTIERKAQAGLPSSDLLSIVEKSIPELEIDDGEYRAMKQKLSAEKHALQGQIAEINARCVTHLPQKEYQKLQNQRSQMVKQLQEKEVEIGELNARRTEVNTVLNVRKSQSMNRWDIRQLVEIRDRWHGFSMDKNNHKQARETAWKISQEIGDVLKRYFDANADA